jgi:hypothetical protein
VLVDDVGGSGTGNDDMFGGSGNDTLRSVDGFDQLFGGEGADHIILDGAARLGGSGQLIDGGTGIDTLTLRFELADGGVDILTGRPNGVESIERLDIEDGSDQTWTWSFNDVRGISDTDALRIEGNVGDTIRLEDDVAGNGLSGGTWVEGITTSASGESWTHYDYVFNDEVRASVSIDTDVDVLLV